MAFKAFVECFGSSTAYQGVMDRIGRCLDKITEGEWNPEKAEKEVLAYIEVSTPHAYWLARSFVLLSDVYVKLDRKLDAKQYLLSLQQNYHADDDIEQMIETRLAKLNSVN